MSESRVEHVDFYSEILCKNMPMTLYLPEGYGEDNRMPVLYFLHGRNGDENIIFDIDLHGSADRMIRAGEMKSMIIVCPRIENSRGVNSAPATGEVKDPHGRIINVGMYADYFIKEVVPFIDQTFHTMKSREGRFIGGASAGGYAALHYALRNQDLFSKVGGHMPAIELRLEEEDKAYFPNSETWRKYDPISIAKENNVLPDMKVYLDAGDMDEGGFYEGCSLLHGILSGKGIASENHIFPGHHNVEYIKSNIEKYLRFYGG